MMEDFSQYHRPVSALFTHSYDSTSSEQYRLFTRECLVLEVERRMTARDVVAILTWLEAQHGTPGAIRSDNGPEFIARAVGKWLAARNVGPLYIAPGSPWENGYSESFNSRMKA